MSKLAWKVDDSREGSEVTQKERIMQTEVYDFDANCNEDSYGYLTQNVFNNDDKYIAAIKHGMCLASMLLADCDSLIIAENENKPKITDEESKETAYLITRVDFDNMENYTHSAISKTPVGVVTGSMYDVYAKIEELKNNVSKYKGWDSIEYPYFEVTELNLL